MTTAIKSAITNRGMWTFLRMWTSKVDLSKRRSELAKNRRILPTLAAIKLSMDDIGNSPKRWLPKSLRDKTLASPQ